VPPGLVCAPGRFVRPFARDPGRLVAGEKPSVCDLAGCADLVDPAPHRPGEPGRCEGPVEPGRERLDVPLVPVDALSGDVEHEPAVCPGVVVVGQVPRRNDISRSIGAPSGGVAVGDVGLTLHTLLGAHPGALGARPRRSGPSSSPLVTIHRGCCRSRPGGSPQRRARGTARDEPCGDPHHGRLPRLLSADLVSNPRGRGQRGERRGCASSPGASEHTRGDRASVSPSAPPHSRGHA
jgi:hypothetical protein